MIRGLKISQKTTYRNNATNSYFNEIKFPVLTPDEEVKLFHQIRMGDQKAYQRVIECNLRFVISVAKQFAPVNNPDALLDLIQEGNMGLIHAIRDFDTTTGFKFISYAVWHIRQRIMMAVHNNKTIRQAANIITDRQIVKKIEDYLETRLERKPTEEEMYDKFREKFNTRKIPFTDEQMKKKVHDYIYEFQGTYSLDDIVLGSETTTLGEMMEDDSFSQENIFNQSDVKAVTNDLLNILNERERKMLEITYGLDGLGASVYRAATECGLSYVRVNQINQMSLSKLRKFAGEDLKEILQLT